MKRLFYLLTLILGLSLSSCDETKQAKVNGYVVDKIVETEIVSSFTLKRERELVDVHQLDTGEEVFVYSYGVYLYHGGGKFIPWESRFFGRRLFNRNEMVEKWLRARSGIKVKIFFSKEGNVIELLPINPNYKKTRVVKKVTKYDGHFAQVDGQMIAHFLSGSSGSLHGESSGGEDFFINVYFAEGKPIFANAKEDRQWLDVEPGDTVIERALNGLISYQIK